MKRIIVNTSKSYSIISQRGLSAKAGELIDALCPHVQTDNYSSISAGNSSGSNFRKLCLICDSNVYDLYGHKEMPLQQSLCRAGFHVREFVFPPGEQSKTMERLSYILEFLAEENFSREDIVLALGGGVTGDLGGFAASVYMRGISCIQMPTTLLAAADSSVGGKTGVNLNSGKNLAGTFRQPDLVLFDPAFLDTLPEAELLGGLAEIIKAAFIADGSILDSISESLEDAVAKAVEVKKTIVEADETEHGQRRLLNLGHTIAHAIEKCSGYTIPHGIAVMTGMYLTSLSADEQRWSLEPVSPLIAKVIDAFAYPLILNFSAAELALAALSDKKRLGSRIVLTYPDKPGHCAMKTIPTKTLEDFIRCGLEKARTIHGNKTVTEKA